MTGPQILFMDIEKLETSFINSDGKVIFYSLGDFKENIVNGENCFICGCNKNNKQFNEEHVLPDWILRRFDLYKDKLTLPNGTEFRYDQYKIPCCIDCNSFLGKEIENYISPIFSLGYDEVKSLFLNGNSNKLFIWFCLIFIKTHLKDRDLRLDRNLKSPDNRISDLYEWESLHHIHCIARALYTEAILAPEVEGSTILLPALISSEEDNFDYADDYHSKTVLMRINDFAIVTVLNDSSYCLNFMKEIMNKIGGPLAGVQLREIYAYFCFLNSKLIERPSYYSEYNRSKNLYKIKGYLPKIGPQLADYSLEDWGRQLFQCLTNYKGIVLNAKEGMLSVDAIKTGKITFLTDDNGKFIQYK